MSDAHRRAAALRKQAVALPDGRTKFSLLQEAIELADSIPSAKLGYDLRRRLIDTGFAAGRLEEMLVAFAWNLAQFDRDPARFDRQNLLWQYKWVVTHADYLGGIPRERVDALLDDMERRHREHGSTLRAVAHIRRDIHLAHDEFGEARKAHRVYLRRKRDDLSDCELCEASDEVDYWLRLKRPGRAFRIGQRALDSGRTCNEQPHGLIAGLLRPLLKAGQLDEARELQRRGYRLIASDERYQYLIDDHVEFLTLIGDFAQAKALIERHGPAIARSDSPKDKFFFFEAMRMWATRLLQRGTIAMKVRLPRDAPCALENGETDLAALNDWLLGQSRGLARGLDERDGDDWFQRRIERLPERLEAAID